MMLIVGAVFIITGGVVIALVNYHIYQEALYDADEKARIILDRNLATHTYFSHQLKPRLFEWTAPIRTDAYFDPVWMSSTYAVREIDKYFRQFNLSGDYYYKEAAVNARSPENEADESEKDFIRKMNENPNIERYSGIRYIEDKPYFVVLRRNEVMEESCLRCHSTPDKAPEDMINQYGLERSFYRYEGEIASAISIRVPLSTIFNKVNDFIWRLSFVLFIVFSLLFVIQFFISKYKIFIPIEKIRNKAVQISTHKEHLGEEIPLSSSGEELNDLITAFNIMSANLRQNRDDLEDKIRERTAELSQKLVQVSELNQLLNQEIEKRNQTEEILRASESRYRALFDYANDAILLCNSDGKILDVNLVACNFLGYTRDELLQMTTMDIISPEHAHTVTDRPEKLQQTGSMVSETACHRKDKEIIPIEVSSRIIEWNRENITLTVARDIRERKKAEEENEKLQRQLRQSQKLETIGTLAGGIAHDFNNILFPISGYTEMTMDEVPEDSIAYKNLEEILKATHRAKDMVKQILSFSRQSAQEKKLLKIQPIIKESLKLLRATLPAMIEIQQDIDNECGPVMADPTQIHQIMMNLCTNAYHAMRENGGVLKVTLNKKELSSEEIHFYPGLVPGAYLMLSVSDMGHGIPHEITDRIFDPYFTTKPPGEGTGLGLSVVHGIVKSHKGRITVYSEPGKGTVFYIYLPLIQTKDSA